MAGAGVNLRLNGFNEYIEKLQDMGKDVDEVVKEQLSRQGQRVSSDLEVGIRRHKRTGKTEKQLKEPKVVQEKNGKYSCQVGFKLPKGLPARFIDRGTPTNRKDPFISRALNRSKLKAEQEKIFEQIVRGE